jgi:hypothetical protein
VLSLWIEHDCCDACVYIEIQWLMHPWNGEGGKEQV